MKYDLTALNEEQLRPVLDTEGAVLVTAGAGSGKTRLLTHRVAYLLTEKGVSPYNILAITFTNKAAREMKERLRDMTPDADKLWISTFHSMCAVILRRNISRLGYDSGFSIYDDAERKHVIKQVAAQICEDDGLPEKIAQTLSKAKNSCVDASEYVAENFPEDEEAVLSGVEGYADALKRSNALDFDDLLYLTYRLLSEFADVREYYQDKFRYIHIDEFQDTNVVQYLIVRLLGMKHGNVLAVGDEDQSIYGWRGANIGNIKRFIEDFGCKIYKLEQNYRSTRKILDVANTIIANNSDRIEKKLWTENDVGVNVEYHVAASDLEEADFVMQKIRGLREKGYRYGDFAVLLRINSLSRVVEQKFMFYNIPYTLYGGFKFYDRKEVKDIMAYLTYLVNPRDNEAFARMLRFPKKGIGEASIDKIFAEADRLGVSAAEAAEKSTFPSALEKKLRPFLSKLELLRQNKDMSPSAVITYAVNLLDAKEEYAAGGEENLARMENIRQLIVAAREFEKLNPTLTLEDYVQQVALMTDMDTGENGDSVSIATVHSAKGLEFKVVFIIGLEEGLFPLARSAYDKAEMEEERRLMYVAVTRAEERLFLSNTRTRFLYGKYKPAQPSCFLKEAGFRNPERREDFYDTERRRSTDYVASDYSQPKRNLQTGGAPLNNLPKPSVSATNLKAGMRVKHKRLGEGVVVRVDAATGQADIEFKSMGKITLALAFAPITVLDGE